MRNLMLLFVCLLSLMHTNAQENFPINGVVSKYNAVHALINAEIHIDSETSIKRAVLLVKDDKILDVGTAVEIPANAIIHNLEGAHVYPSFIDPYTNYGLAEVEKSEWNPRPQMESSTPGAYSWNQALKPEFHASESFSPSNTSAKSLREVGFGTVLTFQNDGIIRGSSAIVSLGDGKAQEELLKPKATANYSFSKGSSRQSYPRSFMGSIALLRQSIYDAIWADHNKDKSNLSLIELHKNLKLKAIIEADNHYAIRNVLSLGEEFKMNFIIKGKGDEYLSLESLNDIGTQLILPLSFPEAYDVSDPYECLSLSLAKMKHWELAPANAALLASAGVSFAFTTSDLKNTKDFLTHLRKAVEHGLSKEVALRALTSVPAKMLGIEDEYGLLKKGMKANFIICEKDLFDSKSRILENWVQGRSFIINNKEEHDYRGVYILKIDGEILPMEIGGSPEKLDAKLISKDTTSVSFEVDRQLVSISYKDAKGGLIRLSGQGKDPIEGQGQLANGDWVAFVIKRKEAYREPNKKTQQNKQLINVDKVQMLNEMGEQWFPNMAYGRTEKPEQKPVLFTNVTLWTNEEAGILENSSLAIVDGKIIAVGNEAVNEIKHKYAFEIVMERENI